MERRGKFTICKIDNHRCKLPKCIEYQGTPEKPCVASLLDLAKASGAMFDLNLILGVYMDPKFPSDDELKKSFSLAPTIYAVADRLGINREDYFNAVIYQIARTYRGRLVDDGKLEL